MRGGGEYLRRGRLCKARRAARLLAFDLHVPAPDPSLLTVRYQVVTMHDRRGDSGGTRSTVPGLSRLRTSLAGRRARLRGMRARIGSMGAGKRGICPSIESMRAGVYP